MTFTPGAEKSTAASTSYQRWESRHALMRAGRMVNELVLLLPSARHTHLRGRSAERLSHWPCESCGGYGHWVGCCD